MIPLWTAAEAQEIDRKSSELYPEAAQALMEEAGHALYRHILLLREPYQKILILAGPGNNGGDAFVAARHLHQNGFKLSLLNICPQKESPLRQAMREKCEALGLQALAFPCSLSSFKRDTFIVDGVCGLGLRDHLRPGMLRDALLAAAAIGARTVLAIDLPSGLLADEWREPSELPLRATHTMTFGAMKLAHQLSPACFACGDIKTVALGFDKTAMAAARSRRLGLSLSIADEAWHDLPPDAHKFTRGHVLVVGGSAGKIGATFLAGEAAMRTGAGWVSVASLSQESVPARPSFLTYENWAQLGARRLERFLDERRVRAVLIGPGAMDNPLDEASLRILAQRNHEQGLGLIFDAGALHGLIPRLKDLRFNPQRTLLTPHPGEWLALDPAHRPLEALEHVQAAWKLCAQRGVSILYKAARPFLLSIEDSQAQLVLTSLGDSRLAKAGSGDVLAGTALALLAAGLSAAKAGIAAQNRVARAALEASKARSYHSLTPTDLLLSLGRNDEQGANI